MKPLNAFLCRWCPYAWMFGLWAVILGTWGLDREPPFVLGPYTVNSPAPGGVLVFDAQVTRQLERQCSVQFSRHMFDSTGMRIDIAPLTNMSAEALENMDGVMDGRLKLRVSIPHGASPGPAKFVTVLDYRCNPLHYVYPIHILMTVDFEVVK